MPVLRHALSAIVLSAASFGAHAAIYEFDTVSKVNLHRVGPVITGILRNTATPFTLTFAEYPYDDFLQRCTPTLLLMLEKPGRYYLTIDYDTPAGGGIYVNCGLELRI